MHQSAGETAFFCANLTVVFPEDMHGTYEPMFMSGIEFDRISISECSNSDMEMRLNSIRRMNTGSYVPCTFFGNITVKSVKKKAVSLAR